MTGSYIKIYRNHESQAMSYDTSYEFRATSFEIQVPSYELRSEM